MLSQAIQQQQKLLDSLRSVVNCIKTYDAQLRLEPGPDAYLGSMIKPGVDSLAALERALRYVGPNGVDAKAKLDQIARTVQTDLETIDRKLAARLGDDKTACPEWVPIPPLRVPQRNAPYLAIFVAYAYAGLGGVDTGLNLLTDWVKADGRVDDADAGTRLLYSRVAKEFATIQVGPANFPLSYSYRVTLDWELRMIGRVMLTDPVSWMRNAKNHACTRGYDAEEGMLKAYLNAAATDLQAAVDSIDPAQPLGDGPGPNDAALAETLIQFDPSTVCSWLKTGRQDQWRAVLQLESGRTLARWVPEAQREGLLSGSEAKRLSDAARRALTQAAGWFAKAEARDIEAGETPQSGPMVDIDQWEPYLVEAEQELVALQRPSD